MEQNDFLNGNSDENLSLSDNKDLDVEKRNKKMTLRVMNNRNPSAILDPETVRAGKVQEKKIKIIMIFSSIMFVLFIILLIFLIVHWTYTDKEIDKLRNG